MANKKSSHSAPEKRKSGNNLTTVREQAAPRRVQYFAESLTEKRRTLVSQKLLKFFWTLTCSPQPGEYNVRFAIKALKSGKAGGVTALMLHFLYYYYLNTEPSRMTKLTTLW